MNDKNEKNEKAEVKKTNGHEFKMRVSSDTVKVLIDPSDSTVRVIHAFVPILNFPNGQIADKVNPRSHEKLPSRLNETISNSLRESPTSFHLRNRGVTILAERASFDPTNGMLTFSVPDENLYGMVDGATTDRVLSKLKTAIAANVQDRLDKEKKKEMSEKEDVKTGMVTASPPAPSITFDQLSDTDVPDFLKTSYLHVEVIVGDIGEQLVPLAAARNTSVQVKEFSLENLGGGFDWIKQAFVGTEFESGRIRYRENDMEPVDIRDVLGILTLFHPKWNQEKREPTVVYVSKGQVLDLFRDEAWRPGFLSLRGVAADILRLYDHIVMQFPTIYETYKSSLGERARLDLRKEVRVKDKGGLYTLPFTRQQTRFLIPDGWVYPILAAHRMLLKQVDNEPAKWLNDPQQFFDHIGVSLVADVVDQSEAMNRNPAAVGRSRPVWNSLRKSVEMRRLNILAGEPIEDALEHPESLVDKKIIDDYKRKKENQ